MPPAMIHTFARSAVCVKKSYDPRSARGEEDFWRRRNVLSSKPRILSENDRRLLRSLLGRYALRYHLSGPDKDDLVADTFEVLVDRPEIFFEKSVEQAVAEVMQEVFSKKLLESR